jgi:opacity protein-like surface antigen
VIDRPSTEIRAEAASSLRNLESEAKMPSLHFDVVPALRDAPSGKVVRNWKWKILRAGAAAWKVAGVSGLPSVSPASEPTPMPGKVIWTGVYIGGHMGAALDKSEFSNPYGSSIFGDDVRSPGPFAGGQLVVNYQAGRIVLGLEADISSADSEGTFTCLQPGRFVPGIATGFLGGAFGATCQVQADWFGTITGRLGFVVDPSGRTLLYGKGGIAWVHNQVDMAINNIFGGIAGPNNATSSSSFTEWGWTIGGGIEYALRGGWSARLEYDYLRFGERDVVTPQSGPFPFAGFPGIAGSSAPDGRTAAVSQDIHAIKLGLNYRFGDKTDPGTPDWNRGSLKDPVQAAPGLLIEVGGRYVYAWGRFQKDLGRLARLSHAE